MFENEFITIEEFERILSPISIDNPVGTDFRYKPLYDQIKEARRKDDDLEQGIWEKPIKKSDWSKVEELCLKCLMVQSKDIQVVSWLLESWIHLYSVHGLDKGLNLLFQISEKFWNQCYPIIDDDFETRVSPYVWINEKLPSSLKTIVLFEDKSKDICFRYLDWIVASQNENLIRKGQVSEGINKTELLTHDVIFKNSLVTPYRYFFEKNEKINNSILCIEKLSKFLDGKCKKEAPSFLKIKKDLELISIVLNKLHLFNEKINSDSDFNHEGNVGEIIDFAEPYEKNNLVSHLIINSRKQAYQVLKEVARYLEKTDIHSPTPFLLNKAIEWEGMKFPELFSLMVEDSSDIRTFCKIFNIDKFTNSNEEY